MKKNILIILIITIIICILLITGVFIYNKFYSKIDEPEAKNELYGEWQSTNIEIYKDGEMSLNIIKVTDKILNVESNNQISICYTDKEALQCTDTTYSYIDNKIYIDAETYLKSGSDVIVDDTNLIFKNIINDSEYSLLYFERK